MRSASISRELPSWCTFVLQADTARTHDCVFGILARCCCSVKSRREQGSLNVCVGPDSLCGNEGGDDNNDDDGGGGGDDNSDNDGRGSGGGAFDGADDTDDGKDRRDASWEKPRNVPCQTLRRAQAAARLRRSTPTLSASSEFATSISGANLLSHAYMQAGAPLHA
eukprot:6198768-Pleurochrysis_carterae.AAC.1